MAGGPLPLANPLNACGLPQAWAGLNAWTVLDTAFGQGHQFLQTWHAWRADPQRPRILHYVGIMPTVSKPATAQHVGTPPTTYPTAMPRALADACQDLSPGFNRLLLDQGQVSLTLCIGPLQAMLTEHTFRADTLFMGAEHCDKWLLKQLSVRCRRGTRLHAQAIGTEARALFADAGFLLEAPHADHAAVGGVYNPPWHISTSRQSKNTAATAPTAPARCAIVGAGLSGATVAHALALRGWAVTVYDSNATPAGGASGLPAGVLAPSTSIDNNPRTRISRSGCRLMVQHARRLLVLGQDWEPTGVQERVPSGKDEAASESPAHYWHPNGAWVKPATLVRALLAQPGITIVGNAAVHALQRLDGVWVLRDAQGQSLGNAELVVIAGALGSVPLLQALPEAQGLDANVQFNLDGLHGIHGTLSRGLYGPHTNAKVLATFPPAPVNGHGSFLPRVPSAQGLEWLCGATFETDAGTVADVEAQHRSNWSRLEKLLPATAAALAPAFKAGEVLAWSGTRCASHDRLPLVGPVLQDATAGLWMSAAMGSRGLSISAVCAELLVAQICAEPLPLEASLVRSLDLRRARRQRLVS